VPASRRPHDPVVCAGAVLGRHAAAQLAGREPRHASAPDARALVAAAAAASVAATSVVSRSVAFRSVAFRSTATRSFDFKSVTFRSVAPAAGASGSAVAAADGDGGLRRGRSMCDFGRVLRRELCGAASEEATVAVCVVAE